MRVNVRSVGWACLSLMLLVGPTTSVSARSVCPQQLQAQGRLFSATAEAIGETCGRGMVQVRVTFRDGEHQQWLSARDGSLNHLWIDALGQKTEALIMTLAPPYSGNEPPLRVWVNRQGWLADSFIAAPKDAPPADSNTLIYVRWHELTWQYKTDDSWHIWRYDPAKHHWLKTR